MPGRGYNGPSSSASSSNGRGNSRGGGSRGGLRGGNRGRGRGGFTYTDMSSMAMDYDVIKGSSIQDNGQDAISVRPSHVPAYAMSSRPPPSFRPVQSAAVSPSTVVAASTSALSSAPPSRPYTPSGPSTFNNNNNGAPFSSYKSKHIGLGAAAAATNANATVIGGRRNDNYSSNYSRYQSDPNLLKPVAFVKSSNIIKPTMDKEEHDILLAQQQEQEKMKSPPSGNAALPSPAAQMGQLSISSNENIPPRAVEASQTMIRDTSSASSKSSVLSAQAAPYARPGSIGGKQPSFLPPTAPTPSYAKSPRVATPVQAETSEEPLYFIDTVGERGAAQGNEDVESESDSGRSAGKMRFFADEPESDTEELYPRRLATTTSNTQKASLPSTTHPALAVAVAEPLHLPITSYARTITDDIPFSHIFQAPVPTELSSSALETIQQATSGTTSATRDPSRKVSKKQAKKEAKERKKERKRNKKSDRKAFKGAGGGGGPNEPRRARLEDSDLEWGSDGPPAAALLGDEVDEDNDEDEEEIVPVATSQSHKGKLSSKNGKRGGNSRKDAAIEAALADYAANIAQDPSEIEALRSFVSSFTNREQLSLDDLDDLAEMRASEDDDDTTSDNDDDERFEERMIKKEFVREQGKKKGPRDEEEKFPIYVPEMKELDSDMDEEKAEIWKSDDELDPNMSETWKNQGKQYLKENKKKRRDASSSSSEEEDEDEMTEEGISAVDTTVIIISDDDDNEEEEEEDELDEDEEDSEEDEDEEDDVDMDELDDEEIDDLLFASLRPARKKNTAPKYLSTDVFDEALQSQWRKDREKKAIKRQERALKRLEGKPSKANSKKAKRAAAKAKGFSGRNNDDSDGMMEMGELPGRVPEFHQINQDLKNFIENSGGAEYALQPMDKKFRYAIHMIADAYNLKSKSRGNGRDRHNVLYRTQHTTVRGANMRKVQKFLSITASWSSGGNKSYTYERPGRGTGGPKRPGNANAGGGNAFVSKNYEGALVGEGADRIAATNIGYGLLAKMGWSEGMTVGKNGGISEPIVAVIKTSKAGLGSGWARYGRS